MTPIERKQGISQSDPLPVAKQCQLMDISRSTAYYQPKPVSDEQLDLMRKLDELHLRYPFYGSRRLKTGLYDEYHHLVVNRKRIRRLMVLMGIQAIYPGKHRRTSEPNRAHKIYPYLLKGLEINRSNQVWCTDITYLPMRKGFAYLVAIMDWHSRKVLSWRISNVMDTDFCVDALNEALNQYGSPEIFNTDQGSQFTSEVFTGVLKQRGIKISMDGKGRWIDNVFIERLWRSVKYEEVYLHAYDDIPHARSNLKRYFEFYNAKRRHQVLGCTPGKMYEDSLPALKITG
jgi:putative transposase